MADLFYFRLDTLLKIRKLKQKQSMVELGRRIGELQGAQRDIVRTKSVRISARMKAEELRSVGVSGSLNRELGVFEDASANDVMASQRRAEALAEQVTKQQEELRKATMKKNAVQVLKDKALEEWNVELRRKEDKELSETALRGRMRRAEGEG